MPTSINEEAVLRAPLGEGHSWSEGQREGRAFVLKGFHETKVSTGSRSPYLVLHPFLSSPPPPSYPHGVPPLSALALCPLPLPPRSFSQRVGEKWLKLVVASLPLTSAPKRPLV